MSKKSVRIAEMIGNLHRSGVDPHYLGYFDCFNRQLFYEAHDVLEELWLAQRGQPNDLFFKGLIQLAGAFVHLQKGRLQPADALFGLAQANLSRYPAVHEHLDVRRTLDLIMDWRGRLENSTSNPLTTVNVPRLDLEPD